MFIDVPASPGGGNSSLGMTVAYHPAFSGEDPSLRIFGLFSYPFLRILEDKAC